MYIFLELACSSDGYLSFKHVRIRDDHRKGLSPSGYTIFYIPLMGKEKRMRIFAHKQILQAIQPLIQLAVGEALQWILGKSSLKVSLLSLP
jgi:hypothetical protein